MSLGDIAAKLPWPCFPCNDRKQPVVATGFKAASTERARILAMFDLPGAAMIGVPTGEASGLLVVDVDIKNGRAGMEWLEANRAALPETRTHKTQSGGLHLVFRYPEGVALNSSASKLAPGIDIRGRGGYIVAPPSPGYTVADTTEPADMPIWLIKAILACTAKPEPAPYRPQNVPTNGATPYGIAALNNECAAITGAPDGSKHDALNKAAYSVGGMVSSGQIPEGVAIAALSDALGSILSRCEDQKAARRTLDAAFRDGMGRPRAVQERSAPRPEAAPPPETVDDGYWASLENDAAMSVDDWRDMEIRETGQAIPASAEAKKAAGSALLWKITEGWADADISARRWIAKGYLMRGAVTVVSGPGSAGKSSLMVAWTCALALTTAFHRFHPISGIRVAIYNVEDDADEQRRRFSAMAAELRVPIAQIMERAAIIGPSGVGTLLRMDGAGRLLVNTPVMDELETWVSEWNPDVLILDPFVELHAEEENDNTAVRAVMARFRAMATAHDMAVVILHHSRKGLASPGDPDSLRGASSIVGAARVALTLNVMTEEEAGASNISLDRRRDYFRLDGAKSNYAPIEEAEWFERRVQTLANTDNVALAWPWKPPNVWKEMSPQDTAKVLDQIDRGPAPGILYTPSARGASNATWVGNPVMDSTGLNAEQAKLILKTWFQNGVLVEVTYEHPTQRKDRSGVRIDRSKTPT